MTLWNEWRFEERRDALIVYCFSRVLVALGVAGVLWLPVPVRIGAVSDRAWAVAAMSILTLVVLLGRTWSGAAESGSRFEWGAPHWPMVVAALLVVTMALTGGPDSPVAPLVVLMAFCWDGRDAGATTRACAWLVGAGASACYLLAVVVAGGVPAAPVSVVSECEHGLALGLLTGALCAWRIGLLTSGAHMRAARASATSWQTQALALERTRGELLAHVSHELMTPLAAIRSCAGLLGDPSMARAAVIQDRSGTAGAYSRMVGAILRNTARLELSVQDLVELARLEEGRPEVHMDWHGCADLLVQAVEALRPLLDSKHQCTRLTVAEAEAEAEVRVWGDARRIERVVTNLLANAHKYAGDGATIVVRATRDGDGTRLEVADDGPGIPTQALTHIFDRYYRAPGVPGQGSGLGLAIVQAEVELHGGRVWAESSAEHGSRFICLFPYPSVAGDLPVRVVEVSE